MEFVICITLIGAGVLAVLTEAIVKIWEIIEEKYNAE